MQIYSYNIQELGTETRCREICYGRWAFLAAFLFAKPCIPFTNLLSDDLADNPLLT